MTSSIPATDRRDKYIGLRGTPDELTRVAAHAATFGLSGNVWARNALIAELEQATDYRDTARRDAARGPNRNPRHDRQGDPAALMLRVSAAEHQAITDHAADKGLTITAWAWGVLKQAMEQEGQQP